MHDYWHPRIEGAINSVILAHPNWFRFRNAEEQRTCVNSLAKRLVGVIVGSDRETAMRDQMLPEAHSHTALGAKKANGFAPPTRPFYAGTPGEKQNNERERGPGADRAPGAAVAR